MAGAEEQERSAGCKPTAERPKKTLSPTVLTEIVSGRNGQDDVDRRRLNVFLEVRQEEAYVLQVQPTTLFVGRPERSLVAINAYNRPPRTPDR
jgi:hypothetical protein